MPRARIETDSGGSELKVFGGLDQAIARLCLRDGRPRKEIAEAARINASMLSGYCSGRLVPSLEHLDRLLSELGVGIEELVYELRAIKFQSQNAPLVVWPGFLGNKEGEAAAALLNNLLVEVRDLLRAKGSEAAAQSMAEPEASPVKAANAADRRRGRRRRPHGDGPDG